MGKREREKKNYISLACLPRLSVRSFVRSFRFGYGYALGADISGEPRSHFQFNLLKARQKVIRYFTSAVDRDEIARASSRSDSGLNGARANRCVRIHVDDVYASRYVWWYHPECEINPQRSSFLWAIVENIDIL